MPDNITPNDQMRIDVAVVKRDVVELEKNITEIKSTMARAADLVEVKKEVAEVKGWLQKIVWAIVTAIIIQVVAFIARGGLNLPVPPMR